MQVTVEDVSSLTKRVKIVLPKENVGQKLEDAYRKLSAKASLKGFRKGKIPRKVLEKNYGPKVEYDLAEQLIQETYFDALEEAKIDAVAHPEIKSQQFDEAGTFTYEAEVDVRPEFELGAYKGIEVEMPEIVVSDDEIDRELEAKRKEIAPLRTVEGRGAQINDIVVIDFQGYHDGQPLKQVHGDNYSVDLGLGRNGKEFEDSLLGAEVGAEISKEISFGAEFANPVLAGKNVEFRINVKDVKERVLPALDDEFAKDVGEEFKTIDDLKAYIREQKVKQKEAAKTGDFSDKLMMKLLDVHDFDIPQRLVAYELNHLINEMGENLQRQGLTLESAGMNREKLAEQYREAAEKRVRGDFILKKIAEKEEIKLEDADIEKGFARIAEQYHMPVDEVKKYFKNREDLLPLLNELLSEKILQFLRAEAKVKVVAAETEIIKKTATDSGATGE